MPRKRQDPVIGGDGQLSERAQHLMKVLVERYIRDGEPVGSRTLARDINLDLSPATIRNIMADLEDLGMVRSPHTSAGRVPTAKGYRLFVDALLTVKPLTAREMLRLQKSMLDEADMDPQALVETTSNMLSAVTHMAGLVTIPKRERGSWRHIEFLPLSDNRVHPGDERARSAEPHHRTRPAVFPGGIAAGGELPECGIRRSRCRRDSRTHSARNAPCPRNHERTDVFGDPPGRGDDPPAKGRQRVRLRAGGPT